MDAILGQTTDCGMRRKLRAMAQGLDLKDFYGATIALIKKQSGEKERLGMAALTWISHSERLLRVDELLHALAVDIELLLGLLVVDTEASTVRLIYFSLWEHLNTFPDIFVPDIFGPTHSIMAETCLAYLNFQHAFWGNFVLPQSNSFLEYSSLYWGIHADFEWSNSSLFAWTAQYKEQYSRKGLSRTTLRASTEEFAQRAFPLPSEADRKHRDGRKSTLYE